LEPTPPQESNDLLQYTAIPPSKFGFAVDPQ